MSLAKSIKIPIECPHCGKKHEKLLSELKAKHKIPCTCGTTITIDPKGFDSLGKSISNLDKTIAKFGKR